MNTRTPITTSTGAPAGAPARSQVSQIVRPAIVSLIVLTLITGVLYPAVITGIAQAVFPFQANGSLIRDESGTVIGSELIGQEFSDLAHFWGRLSATGPVPYNAAVSSGSNYGPLNPSLIGEEGIVQGRITALNDADTAAGVTREAGTLIPVDLVTASASGLDPHISPAAATYQVLRIAALRGVTAEDIQAVVDEFTEGRTLGILGEARVNVLRLNIALDERYPAPETADVTADDTVAPASTTETGTDSVDSSDAAPGIDVTEEATAEAGS